MNKDLYRAAVSDIKVKEELVKELAIKMKEKSRTEKKIGNYKFLAASVVILLVAAIFIKSRFELISSARVGQLSAGNSITLSKGRGTVHINKIEGIASSKLFIPEGAYSKDYTLQQLVELFSRDPLPVIPQEFKAGSNITNITFDAQGKMLFMSAISYSKDINNPDAPSIDIKLNKNALPPKDCLYGSDTLKESTIGSTKVVIGAMSMGDKFNDEGTPTSFYDVYNAEFIYHEVGYSITAKRIDGETFVNLLNSIIK
jgi:hypothetical protein